MNRVCILLSVGVAAATPALTADPLSFDITPMPAAALSLRESVANGTLLSETVAARKDGSQPRAPAGPRQGGARSSAPGRMPIIEPDPNIDFHLLVKIPDASVDYKMLRRETRPGGNVRR